MTFLKLLSETQFVWSSVQCGLVGGVLVHSVGLELDDF